MKINDPAITAEIEAAFADYERALMSYDPQALIDAFWSDPRALRYGIAENLYGHADIAAYRRSIERVSDRTLSNTTIMTYGRDCATANTEFRHDGDPRTGRQTQTWGADARGLADRGRACVLAPGRRIGRRDAR